MLRNLLGSQLWRAVTSHGTASCVAAVRRAKPLRCTTFRVSICTGPQPSQTHLATACRWATNRSIDPALKKYKPTSPGFRHRLITRRDELWGGKPMKHLTVALKKTGGRNNTGRITCRHRGGGHRRRYRVIDFHRNADPENTAGGVVERLEYDPNRTARIALVKYESAHGVEWRYMIAPQTVKAGQVIQSGPEAPVAIGNTMPIIQVPIGFAVHNIEKHPGKGAQLVRSAGTSAQVMARDERYVTVRLPSGEQRRILGRCMATIGTVSNPQHKNIKLGKAGANRWRGRRPSVRGVAMNPVDHPHGGGRGKSKGRISQSPTGVPAKGFRTRKKLPPWANHLITSRHEAKRRSKK